MKIKTIKLFNPVRVGTKQFTYIEPSSEITGTLNPPLIKLEDKEGNTTYTSLYNTPYFTLETPPINDKKEKPSESNSTTKAPRSRGAKKTK